VEIWPNFGLIW